MAEREAIVRAPIPPKGSVTGIAIGDDGEVGVMTNDRFVLIVAPGYSLTTSNSYRNGTVQLTIRRVDGG